jgi:hypothetical protein
MANERRKSAGGSGDPTNVVSPYGAVGLDSSLKKPRASSLKSRRKSAKAKCDTSIHSNKS